MDRIDIPTHIKKVLKLIRSAGFEIYVVGGCVRDIHLGEQPKDWDVTTSALPEQVKEILIDFTVIETGVKHGTITVIVDNNPIEITTFRCEHEYSDNRRPDAVEFVSSLSEDLKRRDFTVNAMAFNDETNEVIDLFDGLSDLKNNLIRCVGIPEERFSEDSLRILRGLRFASVLGFEIEQNTAYAIHRCRSLLKNVSSERIFIELKKLLCGKRCSSVLREFRDVFSVIIPELEPMFDFQQKSEYHRFDVWEHTIHSIENIEPEIDLRLSMLFHDIGKPHTCTTENKNNGIVINHFYNHAEYSEKIANTVLTRLKSDNQTKKNVLYLVRLHGVEIGLTKKSIRRRLNKDGIDLFDKLILVKKADTLALSEKYIDERLKYLKGIKDIENEIISENECLKISDLAIDGNDCLELGFKGKDIGKILNLVLDAVFEDKLNNNTESIKKYISSLKI